MKLKSINICINHFINKSNLLTIGFTVNSCKYGVDGVQSNNKSGKKVKKEKRRQNNLQLL